MIGRSGPGTPSPAMLVAVIALVAGLSGTAIAADGGLTKKTVKKIVSKTVDKEAPELTVGNSEQLANEAPAAYRDPVAYAHVLTDGSVVAAESKGIATANVSVKPLASFCFTGVPQFKSVSVTPDFQSAGADNADVSALVALQGAGGFATGCAGVAGLQAEIATVVDSNFAPHGFYIQFHR